MSDFVPMVAFLASGSLNLSQEAYESKRLDLETQKKILLFAQWKMEALRTWERDAIFNELKALSEALDIKLKDFLAPIFIAISGSTSSFSVMDAMAILGPELSRARLREAVEVLGGAGKKVLKRYEKEFSSL